MVIFSCISHYMMCSAPMLPSWYELLSCFAFLMPRLVV